MSSHWITSKFCLFLELLHSPALGNYILLVNMFLYITLVVYDIFFPETLPEEMLFQIERLQFSITVLPYFFYIS